MRVIHNRHVRDWIAQKPALDPAKYRQPPRPMPRTEPPLSLEALARNLGDVELNKSTLPF